MDQCFDLALIGCYNDWSDWPKSNIKSNQSFSNRVLEKRQNSSYSSSL